MIDRFCVDCKHYVDNEFYRWSTERARCMYVQKDDNYDLVYGELHSTHDHGVKCFDFRYGAVMIRGRKTSCGEDAIFFEKMLDISES